MNWLLRSTGDETLSTAEEHNLSVAEGAAAQIEILLEDLMMAIWKRRGCLAIVTGIGMLFAIGYALLIPNKYTSTAQ